MPASDPDALLREHDGLVRQVARRVHSRMPSSVTVDELYVAGLAGLWRSFDTYNPAAGTKFSTHAARAIRWAMSDWLRESDVLHGGTRRPNGRDRRTAPTVCQFVELVNDEGHAGTVGESLVASADGQADVDARDAVDAMLRGLTRGPRLLVSAHACGGCSIREAARAVGLSPSRAGRVLSEAMEFLRLKFAAA